MSDIEAKRAFSAVYNEDPAEFNRVANSAIKNIVREKIKTMRGEIRDELASRLLDQDKQAAPAPAAAQ